MSILIVVHPTQVKEKLLSNSENFEYSFDLQFQDISSHKWARLILGSHELGDST